MTLGETDSPGTKQSPLLHNACVIMNSYKFQIQVYLFRNMSNQCFHVSESNL